MTLLQSYLDGEVDEISARRITHHLEACRDCGLEAETFARLRRSLRRLERPVDPEALERLRSFVRELS
ncbi:MAG: zf-HC2 domain-containing protein [Actinomycetota bacterium]